VIFCVESVKPGSTWCMLLPKREEFVAKSICLMTKRILFYVKYR